MIKQHFLTLFIVVVAAVQGLSAAIFVSPKGADESATGARDNPYGTLKAAYEAASKVGSDEIVLLDGEYFFPTENVEMKGYPSKNNKLTIRGEGDNAVLIGGIRVPASALELVTNKKLLSKLPAEREGKLYGIDLKKFGVKSVGKMNHIPASVVFSEAYYSEKPLTLARYPNGDGKIKIGEVVEGGFPVSTPEKWPKDKPRTTGEMRYTDMRHERWVNAPDLWLAGVFNPGWLYGTVQLEKIDTQKKTLKLKTDLPWGITTAKRKLDVNAYHAYNLFEEIDIDGEYYIDRENLLFFVMLKNPPKDGAYFDFSLLGKPIISLNNVSNLTIKNLKFTAARTRPIAGRNCVRVIIDGCQFYNLGETAINIGAASVDRYTPEGLARTNNVVQNCKVFDTGGGGVTLSGGNVAKLLPSHNKIYNCEFYNNAMWRKSYAAQASISGVGGFISHCYFHDHQHESVSYGGCEQTVEYNYFERCCRDFHDMGVIYSGRAPHTVGNVIRGNFFAENEETKTRSMMCGVYVDDGSGFVLVENNIFCRTGTRVGPFAAIYIHAGKGNIVRNDIFIDCQASASQLPWKDERWEEVWTKKWPDNVRFSKSELYLAKYPQIKDVEKGGLTRSNTAQNCWYFRTPYPHRGTWILTGGQNDMKPTKEVGKIDYWTAKLVKEYFGDNWYVNDILKKKPGLVSPMKMPEGR